MHANGWVKTNIPRFVPYKNQFHSFEYGNESLEDLTSLNTVIGFHSNRSSFHTC